MKFRACGRLSHRHPKSAASRAYFGVISILLSGGTVGFGLNDNRRVGAAFAGGPSAFTPSETWVSSVASACVRFMAAADASAMVVSLVPSPSHCSNAGALTLVLSAGCVTPVSVSAAGFCCVSCSLVKFCIVYCFVVELSCRVFSGLSVSVAAAAVSSASVSSITSSITSDFLAGPVILAYVGTHWFSSCPKRLHRGHRGTRQSRRIWPFPWQRRHSGGRPATTKRAGSPAIRI